MKCAFILLCAGRGLRLEQKKDKAFISLVRKPLFLYSYNALKQIRAFTQIIIVARESNFSLIRKLVKDRRLVLQRGGRRRQDSVYKGLQCVHRDTKYVVIHDAARPFIAPAMVWLLMREVVRSKAVTLGIKVKEAVKDVEGGYIRKTVERKNLYTIQTPQAFDKELIMQAHKKYRGVTVYDDAQLVEMLGKKVKVIEGSPFNIKITYPEDLVLAEALIKSKGKSRSGTTRISTRIYARQLSRLSAC